MSKLTGSPATRHILLGLVAGLLAGAVIAACAAAPVAAPAAAQATAKWEYQVVRVCDLPDTITDFDTLACLAPDNLQTLLNTIGADGWELVAIHAPLAGYGTGPMFSKPFGGYSSGSPIEIPLDFGRLVFKRQVSVAP